MKYLTILTIIAFVSVRPVMANQNIELVDAMHGSADTSIKVVGIAGLSDGGGMAIISINGQPETTVSVGSLLAPEVMLYKVYNNKVAIQKQGDILFYPLTAGQPYIPPEPIDSLRANGQSRVILELPPQPENDLEKMQDTASNLENYYLEPGQSRHIMETIPEQMDKADEEMDAMVSSEYTAGQSRNFYAIPVATSLNPEVSGIEE